MQEIKKNVKFNQAKEKIIGKVRERKQIGTLSEKSVHAILKYYLCENEDYHEVPICNFVADIFKDNHIYEIQTRNFDKLRNKLNAFLPLYPVTIVHPVEIKKWIYYIDEDTGELSEQRKSPKKENIYQVFSELYKIKSYLKHENLSFLFLFIETEEWRILNGYGKDKKWKCEKYDKIPVAILEEMYIECNRDFLQIIPYDIKEPFTSEDFAKKVKCRKNEASIVLNILYDIGLVERIGKSGRQYLYKVLDDV